ncbi:MAG TPA: hypothetical protein VFV02_14455 [Acidimicrobiales bacterium]|nr:hypothetical protein [Acidimicrobiales bacterium]
MAREWHRGSVELRDGYAVLQGDGQMANRMDNVRFSIEGGFLYVDVHGVDDFQVVPSDAVQRISYQRKARD